MAPSRGEQKEEMEKNFSVFKAFLRLNQMDLSGEGRKNYEISWSGLMVSPSPQGSTSLTTHAVLMG
jgi:hypothetical protein